MPHLGAGMSVVPELLVREVLLAGLVEVAGDTTRINEIVGRFDIDPRGGDRVRRWSEELRAAIRTLPARVRCAVGYPEDRAQAPYLSVVLEGGSEDSRGAVAGDVLGYHYYPRGDGRAEYQKVIGIDETSTVQVGAWATAPEESLLLLEVARNVLFRDKGRLYDAGVHEVAFSHGGDEPNPERFPWTGYVPVLRCTMTWTRRQTRRVGLVPTQASWTTNFSN